MNHELEPRAPTDFFASHDDTYSSIKHEFSRIFHENNLHSFTNATDIGFLDVNKLTSHGISDGGLDDNYQSSYQPYGNYNSYSYTTQNQKGSASPYLSYPALEAQNSGLYSQSPLRFTQQASNVSFNLGLNKQVSVPESPGPTYYTYPGYQGYQHYGQAESPYLDYSTPTVSSNNPGTAYDEYSAHELLDSHPNNALSLMWSNQATKMEEKDPSEHEEEPIEKTTYKVEQEFGKISNKSLGLQLDKAAKKNAEAIMPRRTTRAVAKPSYTSMVNYDDDDASGSDDDKEDGFGESKGRRSRGLRVLSLKVRDIVGKRQKTSYKEVADALLADLAQKMKGRPQAEIAKEEQNVKRRVYDALNVLIAADILRKDGKQVCLAQSSSSSNKQGQNKKGTRQDRQSLLDMIDAARQRKQEKSDAMQELIFKNLAVKNLVRKNMAKEEAEAKTLASQGLGIRRGVSQGVNATRIDVVEENASLKHQSQETISFPFIVLVSGSSENSMNLNMDASQKQLSIDSRKAFDIYGDIDILLKMKLHHVSKSFYESEVPKQLRKYVSPQFISQLE